VVLESVFRNTKSYGPSNSLTGQNSSKISQTHFFQGFRPWRGGGSGDSTQPDFGQDSARCTKFMKNATKPL